MRNFAWFSLPFGLLFACSGAEIDRDRATCTGKCDSLSSEPIVATVAQLWVDKGSAAESFFRVDRLQGAWVSTDGLPLRAVAINVTTADNDAAAALLQPGPDKTVALLRDGKYPARIDADVFLRGDEGDLIGADLSSHLRTTMTVDGPDALPKAKAAALTLPFAIWRVRVTSRVERAILENDAYTVPVGGSWTYGDGKGPISVSKTTLASLSGTSSATFTVLAPPQGPVTGTGYFLVGSDGRTSVPFTIDAPGDYIAEAAGLRKAKPGELDLPPVSETGQSSVPDTSSLPDPPLPPWPTACGNEGEALCQGSPSGCAPHLAMNYADWGDVLCHACGADGQFRCGDDGERSCNPGTAMRYSDWQDTRCHACGGDGQYRCDAGCNPGTAMRYSDWHDTYCHTCGGDGQYRCDAGCNPGFEMSYGKYGDVYCHAVQ